MDWANECIAFCVDCGEEIDMDNDIFYAANDGILCEDCEDLRAKS